MDIAIMIPARTGSTRIKNKNLRLINGKPLVQYIINAAKNSDFNNKIYLNSESPILEEIANNNEIMFYKRSDFLASDKATNDDFVLDFINKINCEILVQLLPTSPFISSNLINTFINAMVEKNYDTMISVSKIQIETIFNDQPINFFKTKKTPPSQNLKPLYPYACGIMAWKTEVFKKNMKKYNAAYHGGKDKVGFFELKDFAKIDIDNEEDFTLAEAVALSLNKDKPAPQYYNHSKEQIFDANVKNILIMDGVKNNILEEFNKEIVSINELIKTKPKDTSWSHTIINSPSNSATLIGQIPGEGNRLHFHPNWDEWWYIIQGNWEWNIEGEKKVIQEGDVIFIERNKKHKITSIGNEMSIRLAVSKYDVDHVYLDKDYKDKEDLE